jgi:hypothetical protein
MKMGAFFPFFLFWRMKYNLKKKTRVENGFSRIIKTTHRQEE